MQMCPKCSWNNFDTARFCSNCGEPLRDLLGQGAVLQGRYSLLRVLGCGGMGAVYLAKDLRLNQRPVAVKENFDNSPEAESQFKVEAELLANLRHPNLPQVFDYFIEPTTGKQYLVMDYIMGDDLEDIVERKGPLKEKEALRIMVQVLDSLAHLHGQNPPIIHRDIKPANIKIQPDGTAVLVDFGIAKRYLPGKETIGAAAAVTPGYSPAEQYGQGITDARSDIYSSGATLYFALTGQVPPEAIERVTKGDNLILPSSINPTVSPHIEQAVLKAMALRPMDRFGSVIEFKTALLTHKRQKPTYTPATPTPFPKRSSRHPSYPRKTIAHNFDWWIYETTGCVNWFVELLFWGMIILAFFSSCRGCLVISVFGFAAMIVSWYHAGLFGMTVAFSSTLAIFYLLNRLCEYLFR